MLQSMEMVLMESESHTHFPSNGIPLGKYGLDLLAMSMLRAVMVHWDVVDPTSFESTNNCFGPRNVIGDRTVSGHQRNARFQYLSTYVNLRTTTGPIRNTTFTVSFHTPEWCIRNAVDSLYKNTCGTSVASYFECQCNVPYKSAPEDAEVLASLAAHNICGRIVRCKFGRTIYCVMYSQSFVNYTTELWTVLKEQNIT